MDEVFGEHGHFSHGHGLYEPEVAIPMIVKLPNSRRKGEIQYGVQHTDILPTILEVVGLPIPSEVEGVSMLSPNDRDMFIALHAFEKKSKKTRRRHLATALSRKKEYIRRRDQIIGR